MDDNLKSQKAESSPEILDKYLGMKVMLPRGDTNDFGFIVKSKRDFKGQPVGVSNDNPILDTSVYTVEFQDGSSDEYTANVIAESLYSQVDDYGEQYTFMDEIIDHQKTKEAVPLCEGYMKINGQDKMVITTRGWEILIPSSGI